MNHRAERATHLLNAWAFAKFKPDNVVDIDYEAGYTGESAFSNLNIIETKTFRNKQKLTARATETRNASTSKLPMGGSSSSRTIGALRKEVDKMFKDTFSKRQLMLLIALFAPAECLMLENKKPGDGKIARMLGFKSARACQIKMKAIDMVVKELFSPIEGEGRMSA